MKHNKFNTIVVIIVFLVFGGNFVVWFIDHSKTAYVYAPDCLLGLFKGDAQSYRYFEWIGIGFLLIEAFCIRTRHPEKVPRAFTVFCCLVHLADAITILAGQRYIPLDGDGWSPVMAVIVDLVMILALLSKSKFAVNWTKEKE